MPDSPAQPLLLPRDSHNDLLLQLVHPPGWRNPVPRKKYNLVVLGGGTAGLVAAVGAASLGARVALVERGLLGGDCLNSGCVPSKALLRSARAIHDVRASAGLGAMGTGAVVADFAQVMERVRRLRAALAPNDSAERLRGLGVDLFLGSGQFLDDRTLAVAGSRLVFERACVATGARPSSLNVPGLVASEPLTSENVFWLTALPRRLAVVGGGPIGCELAQAFRRLGAEVTLFTHGVRLLPREDPEASAILAATLRSEGVEILTGVEIQSVTMRGTARVLCHDSATGRHTLEVDQILMAVGRTPNVEGFGLEQAGVAYSVRDGVTVNDRLRTTNPRIFSAGDVCSAFKFTHAADAMARIVLGNALFHGRARVSALIIPRVTYTDPEVGSVGLVAGAAGLHDAEVVVYTRRFDDVDRAVLDGETAGFARVLVDRRSDRILGATVVSRHAGDLLGEVVLAMTRGIGLRAFSSVIHAYPTRAGVWQRLGDERRRESLTPGLKSLLRRWLAWSQ